MPLLTKAAFTLAGVVSLLLICGVAAQALTLGNPSPDIKKGDIAAGAGFSNDRESIFADYGLSNAGTLDVQAGDLDVGNNKTGSELGIGYRHKLDATFKLGQFPVHLGILGAYRVAHINHAGGNLNFNLIDVGFGGAITPVERLNTFAAAVYERAKSETALPVGKLSKTETHVGLLLGAEYWVGSAFVIGLEAHPGLDDDGLALYGAFKF